MQCGRWLPALLGLRGRLDAIFPRDSMWAKYLAMTIVILYLGMTVVAQRQGLTGSGLLGKFSALPYTAIQFGALLPKSVIDPAQYHDFTKPFSLHGEWWRLITAGFLHFGIMHILFNTIACLQAGMFIERTYGPARMWIAFLVSVVAGSLACFIGSPEARVAGASAGLCGLIGAMIAYGYKRGGTHGETVRNFAIQWAVYILIFGIVVPGISNSAHIGGGLGGFAVAWFFDPHQLDRRGRESDSARIGALFGVALVLICAAFAIRSGIDFQTVIDSGLRERG